MVSSAQNNPHKTYCCPQQTAFAYAAAAMPPSQRREDEQPTYDALSDIYNRGYEVVDEQEQESAFFLN